MKKSTVKVLFMALGMFVLSACSEDLANDGGGAGNGGVVADKLETDLIKIDVRGSNDVGDVRDKWIYELQYTITNKSDKPMSLLRKEIKNEGVVSIFGRGDCIRDNTQPGEVFTQPAKSSCVMTWDLILTNTVEGSPFKVIYEDGNKKELVVSLSYNIIK